MKKSVLQKEWNSVLQREKKLLLERQKESKNFLEAKLDGLIPEKLQKTLNQAVLKGFEAVFEKGSGWIEKTYNKDNYKKDYQIKEYAMRVRKDKKSLKSFGKTASQASTRNLFITGIEGAGLGVLGVGIPDIPIFLSVIFRSIYEISLSFGYTYDTDRERLFVLKILRAALEKTSDFCTTDEWINAFIETEEETEIITKEDLKEQMKEAAEVLSKELLYMKFVQGLPLIGAVGGVADVLYLNKITKYATLKYKKRFLHDQMKEFDAFS